MAPSRPRWLALGVVVVGFGAAAIAIASLGAEAGPPPRIWRGRELNTDRDFGFAASPCGDAIEGLDLVTAQHHRTHNGWISLFPVRRGTVERLLDRLRGRPPGFSQYDSSEFMSTITIVVDGVVWREYVLRLDRGPAGPSGLGHFVGGWEFVDGDGARYEIQLGPDGWIRRDGALPSLWTCAGRTLVLGFDATRDFPRTPGGGPKGPPALCTLSEDGGTFAGKDERGRAVSGRRVDAPR